MIVFKGVITFVKIFIFIIKRGVAQWISASALGAEGRAFESLHSDFFAF